ncbi:TetR/AcrR family transcriptional regulator [Desulfovermiculus halophilus]|uniref:TetR/AcrR family transcriptional regulator n=1 Tax=Desulfovermiculus halophilus TaxID=339722 RepID=UPI000484EED5|nr:TetR/AcrR family transcriptional regulator [Desulfovermiculus halophilus]
MNGNKVISTNTHAQVKKKLVAAVGRLLARVGFSRLNEDLVVEEAGVKRINIFRFFGGLPGLVSAFGESGDFWPSTSELLAETAADFPDLTPEEQMSAFFKSLLTCLRRRPQTLDILAWETLERNELSRRLEDIRVRTALEYFEHLHGEIPDDIDLSAVVALLAGAVFFLSVQSRNMRTFGGIDLQSDAGWKRIEQAIELLMRGSLSGPGKA